MRKSWKISLHIFFWVIAISFFIFISGASTQIPIIRILILFVGYGLINISLFYLNFYWLIPRFLDKNEYRKYGLLTVLAILVYSGIKYALALLLRRYVLVHSNGEVVSSTEYIFSSIIVSVVFIFLSTALKFAVDWFNNERIQRDLENQRLSAELAFLKSQINPHFLFNSLNSIYSLAYQRADSTPEAILKLSEIMRYMLYECNDTKVDLAKELQYLQSYIDMQKIRYGDNVYIDFSINGFVSRQQIVPLLLIAFIENAFKHGIVNSAEHPVQIHIDINNDQLYFYMHNKKHSHNRDAGGGIGLHNVKRRLELLYPGQYQMQIKNEADSYTCELSLNV